MKFKIERETLGKLIFIVLAFVFLVLALIEAGPFALPGIVFTLGIAFVLIWFGDELGAYTGFAHMWKVTPTPGVLIKIAGWLLLSYSLLESLYRFFR